jgi:glycosyltransferase involved in cell wall biosynthesis
MISIIVPVYNVQAYLHRCLSSLVDSTAHFHACKDLDEEVEIIVIDDGSTDRSGAIADLYAEQYEYFKVFHTDNRGLSAARNYGIERSKGDYIMFVDSDDWVSSSFVEVPYRTAISVNADMVIFQFIHNSWTQVTIKRERNITQTEVTPAPPGGLGRVPLQLPGPDILLCQRWGW